MEIRRVQRRGIRLAMFGLTLLAVSVVVCADVGVRPLARAASLHGMNGSLIEVYFATDREEVTVDQTTYRNEASKLMYGVATVFVPVSRRRKPGEIAHFDIVSIAKLTQRNFTQSLRSSAMRNRSSGGNSALIFVHGFNETFVGSIYRLAQIVHDGKFEVVPILYSWPSNGSLRKYRNDTERARQSSSHFGAVLAAVQRTSGIRRTSVFAHSMGNLVALEGIADITTGSSIFHLLLASPDLEVDKFKRLVQTAARRSRHTTVLTSRTDPLLWISGLINGSVRAGRSSSMQLNLKLSPQISLISMDQVGGCVGGTHRCAETNPIVLEKIRRLLHGG